MEKLIYLFQKDAKKLRRDRNSIKEFKIWLEAYSEKYDKYYQTGEGNLKEIFETETLDDEQAEIALGLGEELETLKRFQKIPQEKLLKVEKDRKDREERGESKEEREELEQRKFIELQEEHAKFMDPIARYQAIERGDSRELFFYFDLSDEEINQALDVGKNLDVLYRKQTFSDAQIDRAIEIGQHLDVLLMRNLSPV